MTLRKRISLVAAAVVAVAVAIAMVVSYFAVRNELVSQIDGELRAQAGQIQADPNRSLSHPVPTLGPNAGGPTPYIQVVLSGGTTYPLDGDISLPSSSDAAAVAAGTHPAYFTDVDVGGTTLRQYTFPVPGWELSGQTIAFQIARPLAPITNVLSRLKWILAIVFLAVVALAAVLARLTTRRVMSPLAEVTATAEAIAETEDLDRRIEVRENDEVGQLAQRFNEMLERLASSRAALDESVTAQRQLVADASHELRTPVTSLRTNIEVLLADSTLDEEDRRRLLSDVVEQSEELSTLVADLIEVARGDLPNETIEDVRLDRLMEDALHRARRNSPETVFSVSVDPVVVQGNAERLSRAINNLLDNAARHTDPGTEVEVAVDADGVRVRDHGQGIAQSDLPHVFDRFYRGADSRARQGSGLGLAIVRQVAEQHGGSVSAANAPDGGAVFTMQLPTSQVSEDSPDEEPAESTPTAATDSAPQAADASPAAVSVASLEAASRSEQHDDEDDSQT